jgi:glucoamylase
MRMRGERTAFGAPGMDPRWSHGNKAGVGTSYSQDSRVWFTLFRGVVTEVYYPLIDHPQTRDMQFLIADGQGLFHEERRHLVSQISRLSENALGYRIVNKDPGGRYTLHKEVIAAPHLPCVLQQSRLEVTDPAAPPLSLYLLAAPHLDVGGAGNNAYVVEVPGRTFLAAERNGVALALGATVPFRRASVGYVGRSDGWTDLNAHQHMEFEFDRAVDGNVALTGELDVGAGQDFTVALAFGRGLPHAIATLLQALGVPYEEHRRRFQLQWDRIPGGPGDLGASAGDAGNLLHASYSVLLAHEDKTFPGAFIASLSIPWGHAKGDSDRGGYHLVWTRDLVHTALGLLAAGDLESPRRTLLYLAASQQPDGGFPQNFWLDGTAYWQGVQLDEVAFPIVLAARLEERGALGLFDPYPMILGAAQFLVDRGPATEQERWEEVGGFSPSTLAISIAALVAAGRIARTRNDPITAGFLEGHADFLESHLEAWTVTDHGTLVPGIRRHYVRILPSDPSGPRPPDGVDGALVPIANQVAGARTEYPAQEIVDPGFLELVRYGVRGADEPLIVNSLKVIDSVLKVDTPYGPAWHRYNHDGYGDPGDGTPFTDAGVGRAWPLLTGERGHYELARGGDPKPYLRAMEQFANATGMLPEQVWDLPDRPAFHLRLGRPTEAAMPLAWAHSEYLELLRSVRDGRVFDRLPAVAERYDPARRAGRPVREIWQWNYQPTHLPADRPLRVQSRSPFRLHWSIDGWATLHDSDSQATAVGIHYVDLPDRGPPGGALVFTFWWSGRAEWEGRDYSVTTDPAGPVPR